MDSDAENKVDRDSRKGGVADGVAGGRIALERRHPGLLVLEYLLRGGRVKLGAYDYVMDGDQLCFVGQRWPSDGGPLAGPRYGFALGRTAS